VCATSSISLLIISLIHIIRRNEERAINYYNGVEGQWGLAWGREVVFHHRKDFFYH